MNLKNLPVLIFFLVKIVHGGDVFNTCPREYPYAFSNGKYCCGQNVEDTYVFEPDDGDGSECDGEYFTRESACCKPRERSIECKRQLNDDGYVECTDGNCEDCK